MDKHFRLGCQMRRLLEQPWGSLAYEFLAEHPQTDLLLACKSNVWSKHPLHLAVEQHNPYVIERLLEIAGSSWGLDLQCHTCTPGVVHCAFDSGLNSALVANAYFGFTKTVGQHLTSGTGGSTSDDERETALRIACGMGHFQTVQLLLEYGVDPNASSRRAGMTPLHIIFVQCSTDTQNRLLDVLLASPEINVNVVTSSMQSPLSMACSASNSYAARRLLERGANPNDRSITLSTPLLYCVFWPAATRRRRSQRQVYDTVEVLLGAGADLETRDMHNYNALTETCQHGLFDTMKLLLDAGANPDGHQSLANQNAPNTPWPLTIVALDYLDSEDPAQANAIRTLMQYGANPFPPDLPPSKLRQLAQRIYRPDDLRRLDAITSLYKNVFSTDVLENPEFGLKTVMWPVLKS